MLRAPAAAAPLAGGAATAAGADLAAAPPDTEGDCAWPDEGGPGPMSGTTTTTCRICCWRCAASLTAAATTGSLSWYAAVVAPPVLSVGCKMSSSRTTLRPQDPGSSTTTDAQGWGNACALHAPHSMECRMRYRCRRTRKHLAQATWADVMTTHTSSDTPHFTTVPTHSHVVG